MSEATTYCVRLACSDCCRGDYDGITPEQLDALRETWATITEFQSYEESITTYDDPDDAPPGYCVLDWHTHIGTCPDCQE